MKTICGVLVAMCSATAFAAADPNPLPMEPEYRALLRILEQQDAHAIRTYLKEPIEYNGLWFEDASCRTRFATQQ